MVHAYRVLPGDAASLISKPLREIVSGARDSLLSVGALAALWGASNGTASIMRGLNAARKPPTGARGDSGARSPWR